MKRSMVMSIVFVMLFVITMSAQAFSLRSASSDEKVDIRAVTAEIESHYGHGTFAENLAMNVTLDVLMFKLIKEWQVQQKKKFDKASQEYNKIGVNALRTSRAFYRLDFKNQMREFCRQAGIDLSKETIGQIYAEMRSAVLYSNTATADVLVTSPENRLRRVLKEKVGEKSLKALERPYGSRESYLKEVEDLVKWN